MNNQPDLFSSSETTKPAGRRVLKPSSVLETLSSSGNWSLGGTVTKKYPFSVAASCLHLKKFFPRLRTNYPFGCSHSGILPCLNGLEACRCCHSSATVGRNGEFLHTAQTCDRASQPLEPRKLKAFANERNGESTTASSLKTARQSSLQVWD